MSSNGCLWTPAHWTSKVPGGHGHTFSALEARPPPGLAQWLETQRTVDLHLSVVTIAGVERA